MHGNTLSSRTNDWTERISLLPWEDWALSIPIEVSGGREEIIANHYKKNIRKIAFVTNLYLYNINFKISLKKLKEKLMVFIVSQE